MTEFPRKVQVREVGDRTWATRIALAVDGSRAWCVMTESEDEYNVGEVTRIVRWPEWQEIPTTTRLMTHAEVLEKVTTTPGMVSRYTKGEWRPAQFFPYGNNDQNSMEWAIIKDGVYSEPQKFEVTDDE